MRSEILIALKDKLTLSKREAEIIEPSSQNIDTIKSNWAIPDNSLFGAIVYETGGIVFDGWVRVLGCGERNLADWNNKLKLNGVLVVADDILGGLFGLNIETNFIHYFAPDTLAWEKLDFTYSEFIYWLSEGDVDMFYESFRWDDWTNEVKGLTFSEGISFYPPLWAAEKDKSRKAIPLEEIVLLSFEYQKQLNLPDS